MLTCLSKALMNRVFGEKRIHNREKEEEKLKQLLEETEDK